MEKHTTEVQTERLAELEKTLANKIAIVEKLIRDKDKIIERELRQYDEGAFYIHLQSRCFRLYPLMAHVLMAMIYNECDRVLFATIIRGKDIQRFAKRTSTTPEKAVKRFCEIVRMLHRRTKEVVEMIERRKNPAQEYKELMEKYEEAMNELYLLRQSDWNSQAEMSSLRKKNATLQDMIFDLKEAYTLKDKERLCLVQQLEKEKQERNALIQKQLQLQAENNELTGRDKGFWGRVLWLLGA